MLLSLLRKKLHLFFKLHKPPTYDSRCFVSCDVTRDVQISDTGMQDLQVGHDDVRDALQYSSCAIRSVMPPIVPCDSKWHDQRVIWSISNATWGPRPRPCDVKMFLKRQLDLWADDRRMETHKAQGVCSPTSQSRRDYQ